ncbi:MAG: hypothetical protein A4E32_01803 [Methanomassiliicoccales archaeon PtaU1.Bin124]|nr:MAG: hypothetical protein A4E32_01803 [Methanomassiliicoccales archaeon PtaU1.Bin124]
MHTKLLKYPAIAVAALLLLSFGLTANASAASTSSMKYQETVPVVWEGDIPLEDLEPLFVILQNCEIEIPECLLEELATVYLEGGSVHIAVNGMAYISLTMTERYGLKDILFQGSWTGTILIVVGEFSVLFDMNCAHLSVRTIGTTSCTNMNVNILFCTNGHADIAGPCGDFTFNLNTEGKIRIRSSHILMWSLSPEWLATAVPQPDEASFAWLESFFPAPTGFSWAAI